ncbi:MAG: hypothetical protein AAFY48_02890 [Bacteroidota bacterium]
MKLFNKYYHNEANEEEQSAMTELLIQKKYDQALRQKMAARLANEYGIQRTPVVSNLRARRLQLIRWGGSIAAAVLLGLAIWQISSPQLDYQALTVAYLSEQMPETYRGKGWKEVLEQRDAAIQAYVTEDYATAAQLWALVTQAEEAEAKDFLYLGLSYLFQEEPQLETAITALQQALTYTNKDIEQVSRWYLSLAYLQAEQPENARPLLEEIIANEHWNIAKAKELLKRIPQQ